MKDPTMAKILVRVHTPEGSEYGIGISLDRKGRHVYLHCSTNVNQVLYCIYD